MNVEKFNDNMETVEKLEQEISEEDIRKCELEILASESRPKRTTSTVNAFGDINPYKMEDDYQEAQESAYRLPESDTPLARFLREAHRRNY